MLEQMLRIRNGKARYGGSSLREPRFDGRISPWLDWGGVIPLRVIRRIGLRFGVVWFEARIDCCEGGG